MALVQEMAAVAVECIKKPGRVSVWSPELGKYICNDDPRYRAVASEQSRGGAAPARPRLDPAFKLVFLTSAGGTLLFVGICIAVTLMAGKDMPDPLSKLVTGLFDLAKIGFGAVVGLLGAPTLNKGRPDRG